MSTDKKMISAFEESWRMTKDSAEALSEPEGLDLKVRIDEMNKKITEAGLKLVLARYHDSVDVNMVNGELVFDGIEVTESGEVFITEDTQNSED